MKEQAIDLAPDEYNAVYAALRKRTLTLRNLRGVMAAYGCSWSIASWSKFERGLLGLRWDARTALRRYAGLPDAPMRPEEAAAAVERVVVCSSEPDTAVVVGPETSQVVVRKNGANRGRGCLLEVKVTQVTTPRNPRKRRKGIPISPPVFTVVREQKRRLGLSWNEAQLILARHLAGLDAADIEVPLAESGGAALS